MNALLKYRIWQKNILSLYNLNKFPQSIIEGTILIFSKIIDKLIANISNKSLVRSYKVIIKMSDTIYLLKS